MATTTMSSEDITASIREYAATLLRKERPYMKTETSNTLVDKLTTCVRDGLQDQEEELKATKARANFFILPTELRNIIYELVLVSPGSITRKYLPPSKGGVKSVRRQEHKPFSTTLLGVSRRVRQEALPIFWGANKFRLDLQCDGPKEMLKALELQALKKWRISRTEAGAAMIRTLNIKLDLVTGGSRVSTSGQFVFSSHYAASICKRTGATRTQIMRGSLVPEEWDMEKVMPILPHGRFGIEASAIELRMKIT